MIEESVCSADERSGLPATHQFCTASADVCQAEAECLFRASVNSDVLAGWVQTWRLGHCSFAWAKKSAVSLNCRRNRKKSVILFEKGKDLVLIGAGCVCATPSSLVRAHLPEQHGQPTQCNGCSAACRCTWLRFAALLEWVPL